MAYTVARVSAVTKLTLGDIFREGHTVKLRLQEKGGRQHVMPLHHELVAYLDAYLQEAQLPDDPNHPLFPSATRQRDPELTGKHLDRRNVWDMVKRRAKAAGIDTKVCNHTFRATGITTYLTEGGLLEEAQNMAAHADIRTTRIYDHRSKIVTQSHVERIRY